MIPQGTIEEVTMALTMWADVHGRRLAQDEMAALRLVARRAFEANHHIFEDEAEALEALGVHSLVVASFADAGR